MNRGSPVYGVAIVLLGAAIVLLGAAILLLGLSKCGSRTSASDFDPWFDGGVCRVSNWDVDAPKCGCGEYQNKGWSNRVHEGCRVIGCEHGITVEHGETCVVDMCCTLESKP